MRAYIVIAAGVIMVLSSAAHGLLGWPAMRTELNKIGAAQDLSHALATGWYFGSVAMLAFGLITILSGLRLKRNDRSGASTLAIIAAGYIVFGTCALVQSGFNTHFLLFILTGVLAGAPLLGGKRT